MNDFPQSIKHPANLIDPGSQYSDDIEGYVFDGVDGSQVAFWTCRTQRTSKEHRHPFDEYMVVVAGQCTVHLEDRSIELGPGNEIAIPPQIAHHVTCAAGTRTIHHFAGHRATRLRREAR